LSLHHGWAGQGTGGALTMAVLHRETGTRTASGSASPNQLRGRECRSRSKLTYVSSIAETQMSISGCGREPYEQSELIWSGAAGKGSWLQSLGRRMALRLPPEPRDGHPRTPPSTARRQRHSLPPRSDAVSDPSTRYLSRSRSHRACDPCSPATGAGGRTSARAEGTGR
jgi:hypothetical protein